MNMLIHVTRTYARIHHSHKYSWLMRDWNFSSLFLPFLRLATNGYSNHFLPLWKYISFVLNFRRHTLQATRSNFWLICIYSFLIYSYFLILVKVFCGFTLRSNAACSKGVGHARVPFVSMSNRTIEIRPTCTCFSFKCGG